jgi:peptidoglycan-associated lipoprotein
MMRHIVLIALAIAAPAAAQPQSHEGPRRTPYPGPPPVDAPVLAIPVLQADLTAKAGSDTVRFGRDSYVLTPQSLATLTAQAKWLIQHPYVRASIEGHADGRQTRDYALALGERRAAAVRNYLIASGVAPEQLDTVSWGKERPTSSAAHDATWLQNSRVVTVLKQPPPLYPPMPQPLPPQR